MPKKVVSFRASNEIWEYLKKKIEENPKANKAELMNDLFNKALQGVIVAQPNSVKYPPNLYCPTDSAFYFLETILDSCEKCRSKRRCPAWKKIT